MVSRSCWTDGLPPEILAYTFRLLAADIFFTSSLSCTSSNTGFIAVSHVCRYWRRTALDDTGLWGYDLTCPLGPAFLNKLHRSRAAPISVRWVSLQGDHVYETAEDRAQDPVLKTERKYFNAIIRHASRLRALRIDDHSLELWRWRTLIAEASPILETLELGPDVIYRVDSDFGLYVPDDGTLADSIPSLDEKNGRQLTLPFLRYLRLSRRTVRWASPIFSSSLIALHVELDRADNAYRNPAFLRTDVLLSLSSMTKLESLVLVFAIPELIGPDAHSQSLKADLPSLRSLVVVDKPERTVWFLDRVIIPPAAHLTISSETPNRQQTASSRDAVDCCKLIPFISRQATAMTRSNGSSSLRAVEITIECTDDTASYGGRSEQLIQVRVWDTNFDNKPEEMEKHTVEPALAFCILIGLYDPLHNLKTVFHALCDALACLTSEVTMLRLDLDWTGDPDNVCIPAGAKEALFRIIDYTPNIQVLTVKSFAVPPTLTMLSRNEIGLPMEQAIVRACIKTPVWVQHSVSDSPKKDGPFAFVERSTLVLPHLNRLCLEDDSFDGLFSPERWRTDDVLVRTLAARRAMQEAGESFHLSLVDVHIQEKTLRRLVEFIPKVDGEDITYYKSKVDQCSESGGGDSDSDTDMDVDVAVEI